MSSELIVTPEPPAAQPRRGSRIKIEVFEKGARSATIRIPLWVAKAASTLVRRQIPEAMAGIDLDEVLRLAENPPDNGILLDVEDHRSESRVIISIGVD